MNILEKLLTIVTLSILLAIAIPIANPTPEVEAKQPSGCVQIVNNKPDLRVWRCYDSGRRNYVYVSNYHIAMKYGD